VIGRGGVARSAVAPQRRTLARRHGVRVVVGVGFVAAALIALATVELAARTSVNSARIGGGEAASAVWRARIGGVRGWLAAVLSRAANAPARAAFAWRHAVDLDAYDRRVGVHVLGETYPGLNSYPDKLRDTIPAPGLLAAPSVRILVGLNRRGTVELRVPIEGWGPVAVAWNGGAPVVREIAGSGDVVLAGLEPLRGINLLEIHAPPSTVISTIKITAAP
jgi:hypothetical protein